MRSSRVRVLVTALALSGLAFPMVGQAPARAAGACTGTFHARGLLTGFRPFAGSLFYAAREGNSATATIAVTPGCSDSEPGTDHVNVQFVTEPGTATSGQDYQENDDQTDPLCADVHGQCWPTNENVTLTMGSTGTEEPAVEAFRFRLTGTTPTVTSPNLQEPFSVPVYVIDVDGPGRASLEPGVAYSRSESFSKILIPVFAAGESPPSSVSYTITPDPNAPATPGEDFNDLTGGSVGIQPNGVGFIDIQIINDKIGEGPESVTITLMGTVDGAASTTFTILDNEENVFPVSRFHHPREKWKYNKADYRIREFHIFATDEGGSGVVAAELALRRNLANGKCAWKAKKGWQKKDCQNRTWLPTKYDDVGELFYYRMKQLKPSVKTKIKNYTAFSRAVDGAGNVEKEFTKKRNANTFEIRRKGKTQKAKS
jgi:hypothetical protein